MPTKKKQHTPAPTNRKKGQGRGRRKSHKSRLRRMPSYALWLTIAVIAVVYVAFFYKTFVGPYSFRWKAIFTNVTYPTGKVRGIDVSHYQQDIDWEKLRNAMIQDAPVGFVIVKATEGTRILDENFNQNFFNAKKHDIIRGAYHYFSTTSSPEAQAKYFCKMAQLDVGDLPPVLDVEDIGDCTPEQLRKNVKRWLDIVEKRYGVTPILYTGYKFRTKYLNTPEFDKYPFWIAHYYVDKLQYTGKWTFWKHTDVGKVDGIRGYVDINMFNGEMKDLLELTIKEKD